MEDNEKMNQIENKMNETKEIKEDSQKINDTFKTAETKGTQGNDKVIEIIKEVVKEETKQEIKQEISTKQKNQNGGKQENNQQDVKKDTKQEIVTGQHEVKQEIGAKQEIQKKQEIQNGGKSVIERPTCISENLYNLLVEMEQTHILHYIQDHEIIRANTLPETIYGYIKELEGMNWKYIMNVYKETMRTYQEGIEKEMKKKEWLEKNSGFLRHFRTNPYQTTTLLHPIENIVYTYKMEKEEKLKYILSGAEFISHNKLGVLILSGGQGTRLGWPKPKGTYILNQIKNQYSLFQLFAYKIRRIQHLVTAHYKDSRPMIPVYIMTSVMNHQETKKFFKDHEYFGLKEEQITFFSQGTLPCFDNEGKIMLDSRTSLSKASDGNGGIYRALQESNLLNSMKTKGVEYLHIVSVDNAMCRVADPLFVGYTIGQKSEIGNKIVEKTNPNESIGLLVQKSSKEKPQPVYTVVEYSEITEEDRCKVNLKNGKLMYGAGNICNHLFSIEFLIKTLDKIQKQKPNGAIIPFHLAKKKIPYLDLGTGQYIVSPKEITGVKLEAFIFDIFEYCENMAVLGVSRQEEFSPVKNANEVDSPETARLMMTQQFKKWIETAGGKVVNKDADMNITKEKTDETKIEGGGKLEVPETKTAEAKPQETAGEAKSTEHKTPNKTQASNEPHHCMISPLTSYAGEGLTDIVKDETYVLPFELKVETQVTTSTTITEMVEYVGKDLPIDNLNLVVQANCMGCQIV